MEDTRIRNDVQSAKNALVVDDGLVERLLGKTMLEKLGFSVSTSSSGEEALQLIDEKPVDLVFCDIAMPGMDGLKLLDTARHNGKPPPLIMSTNHNDSEHALASMRLGARGYLTKPLRFESLRDAVSEVMARHYAHSSAGTEVAPARIDPLTNLAIRSDFLDALGSRLQSSSGGKGALLLIKLQGLTHINHTYGREAGNKVLKLAAATLMRVIRQSDKLSRFGGDLFAIYLEDVQAAQLEERALSFAL